MRSTYEFLRPLRIRKHDAESIDLLLQAHLDTPYLAISSRCRRKRFISAGLKALQKLIDVISSAQVTRASTGGGYIAFDLYERFTGTWKQSLGHVRSYLGVEDKALADTKQDKPDYLEARSKVVADLARIFPVSEDTKKRAMCRRMNDVMHVINGSLGRLKLANIFWSVSADNFTANVSWCASDEENQEVTLSLDLPDDIYTLPPSLWNSPPAVFVLDEEEEVE